VRHHGAEGRPTIQKIAVETGMRTMIQDGLEKVAQGLTTLEEIVRATKE